MSSTATAPSVRESDAEHMKVAMFDVNGINGRLAVLLRWLTEDQAGPRTLAGTQGITGLRRPEAQVTADIGFDSCPS